MSDIYLTLKNSFHEFSLIFHPSSSRKDPNKALFYCLLKMALKLYLKKNNKNKKHLVQSTA